MSEVHGAITGAARSALAGPLAVIVLALGCQGPPAATEEPTERQAEQAGDAIGTIVDATAITVELPAELNTAQAAAQAVAGLPPVDDALTRVEIALHGALYRAAFADRAVASTRHIVIEPARRREADSHRPELSIDESEFHLRVLATLADLPTSVAWATGDEAVASPFFPGTRELATRLLIRIVSRDPAQATVIAEIGDATRHMVASRQRVTAIWDGRRWTVQPDRVRLVW